METRSKTPSPQKPPGVTNASTDRSKLGSLHASTILRGLSKELGNSTTIGQASAFVMIVQAGEKGIDQGALTNQLGISQSAGIRAVRTLSETDWDTNRNSGRFKDGLGLIKVVQDSQDFRRRNISLSDQGKVVARRLGLM